MKKVFSFILTVILLVLLFYAGKIYNKNNFGEYARAELKLYTSTFSRDNEVKFSRTRSYKIQSDSFNDALFHKSINVKRNTPYKVTAMVKTENVVTEMDASLAGAQICIYDTTECSRSIKGDVEFTKLEFVFNSKNRDSVDICFRLGGYDSNAKGTVWFSDITLEESQEQIDTTWNFACLIFENIDVKVNIDGEEKDIKIKMNISDIEIVKDNMNRFKNSIRELSGSNMIATYDIINVKEPITHLSYNQENGYFVQSKDITNILDEYCKDKEYDHIFIAIRLRR